MDDCCGGGGEEVAMGVGWEHRRKCVAAMDLMVVEKGWEVVGVGAGWERGRKGVAMDMVVVEKRWELWVSSPSPHYGSVEGRSLVTFVDQWIWRQRRKGGRCRCRHRMGASSPPPSDS